VRWAILRVARSHYLQSFAVGRQCAVNPCRIPNGDDTGREIARHYRACADDGVVADRYSRADDDAAAKPDVVAKRDRAAGFPTPPPRIRIDRMRRREKLHLCRELAGGADPNRNYVQQDPVVVHERARAERDVVAVIASKVGMITTSSPTSPFEENNWLRRTRIDVCASRPEIATRQLRADSALARDPQARRVTGRTAAEEKPGCE
jgi:hypothetical protein